MGIKDLTTEQLIEIYNKNFDTNFSSEQLSIETDSYGNVEIHQADSYDDMVLNISSQGAIYLYCLDNGEIYNDCLGALKTLKKMNVQPFA